MEQGLALDESVRMKMTSLEGEEQRESGGHQSPPTTGAAWRGAVPHPLVFIWCLALEADLKYIVTITILHWCRPGRVSY